jgi:hypothetical protein
VITAYDAGGGGIGDSASIWTDTDGSVAGEFYIEPADLSDLSRCDEFETITGFKSTRSAGPDLAISIFEFKELGSQVDYTWMLRLESQFREWFVLDGDSRSSVAIELPFQLRLYFLVRNLRIIRASLNWPFVSKIQHQRDTVRAAASTRIRQRNGKQLSSITGIRNWNR